MARIDQIPDCFLLAGSDDDLPRVIVDSLEASVAYGVVRQTRVFPVAG